MTTATAKDPSSARTVARQQRARDEKVATRELLLESARSILRSGSLFDLTAISLGNQSGMTRQTVYRYFPNTESIFKALSDQVITQVYEDLQLPSENEDALDHFVTKAIGVFVSDSMVIRQLVLASHEYNCICDACPNLEDSIVFDNNEEVITNFDEVFEKVKKFL